MKNKHVIVGMGEIGSSVAQLLEKKNIEYDEIELNKKPDGEGYQVMHVCIPYSEKFETVIAHYIEKYKPEMVIIHSTVKPGTTYKIQSMFTDVVISHSPVRGVHPNLYEGLVTFVKFFSCLAENESKVREALESIGLIPEYQGRFVNTELGKILSTSYYGWCIMFAKQCKKLCDKFGADYEDVYTRFNETYDEGYTNLDKKHFVRPVLYPPKGKVGGHCVSQNYALLPQDSKLVMFYGMLNEEDNIN